VPDLGALLLAEIPRSKPLHHLLADPERTAGLLFLERPGITQSVEAIGGDEICDVVVIN